MSSELLDSILDNHSDSRIISEQHDVNAINIDVDAALASTVAGIRSMGSDGRPAWDANEYGISAEEVARRIEATTTPEAKQKLMVELRDRAIRRASLDTSNGRVNAAFAFKPAWHGLGTVFNGTMNSEEAARLAGINWLVEKLPLTYSFAGETRQSDSWSIVRADTGKFLGTVGPRYVPIQNEKAFDFLDGVIGEFGAQYESAGSIYGGKSIWLLAHMPKHAFRVNGDEIEPYVLFTNCHDGTGAAACYPTTMRVECANTFRTSGKDRVKGLSIRHTGRVEDKIKSAQNALGLAVQGFEEFGQAAQSLVTKPCNIKYYLSDVLDATLDVTEAQVVMGAEKCAREQRWGANFEAQLLNASIATTEANLELETKAFEKKIERRGEILNDILERYESERCHPRGTAWAAFNSVTEFADHNTIGRQRGTTHDRDSRRLESVLGGERDEMKQVAFQKALAL